MSANDGKNELRVRMRAVRDAIAPATRSALAQAIASHGAQALQERAADAIVAAYWPIRSEADPRPLARALAQLGARLALPVVHGDDMTFRSWSGGEGDLVPAGFGALGPAADAPAVTPTIVLAPLLGFDARGQRLGWGKGYYDRYLAHCAVRPFVVGVAFACQEVAVIPGEPHDQCVDAVLTERGLLRC